MYASESRSDLKYILLSSIASAKNSLYLATYGSYDHDLLKLIKKKAKENLAIQIIFDKSYPLPLKNKNIELIRDPKSGLMHRKLTIIDDSKIFLGSTNSTESSLKLHRNLLLYMEDASLAKAIKLSELYETDKFTYFPLPDESESALNALNSYIDNAKKRIDLAMYTFTHLPLAEKLIEARNRGVEVHITLDWGMAKGTSRKVVKLLKEHNVPLFQQLDYSLFHHKCALIDDVFVMGSVNWTKSGFNRNREYMMSFHDLNKNELGIVKKFFSDISYQSKRLRITKNIVTKKIWRIPYFPSHFLSSCSWIPSGTSPSIFPYYEVLKEDALSGLYSEKCA